MTPLNLNFPNKYFIETGSFYGESGCFQQLFSIELAPHFVLHCKKRFAAYPNVTILEGDSTHVLPKLLAERIDAPATFWLDGHYSSGNTVRGMTNSPILAELDSIQNHPIKTHTILIDDVRQFGSIEFDFVELDEVIQKIKEINPKYQISFGPGCTPTDVLIATVMKEGK
jgi:hypothetical protein